MAESGPSVDQPAGVHVWRGSDIVTGFRGDDQTQRDLDV